MSLRETFSILFVSSLLILGCSPKASDIVVLEVGMTKVNLAEYEYYFTRISGNFDSARQSSTEKREQFLDLLTNYKLEVNDAYDRNLLNDPDIVNELAEMRSSLASAFMLEHGITEPGIKRLYDRRKEEIRVQHILLSVKPDAAPEETAKAYSTAMDIIRRAAKLLEQQEKS